MKNNDHVDYVMKTKIVRFAHPVFLGEDYELVLDEIEATIVGDYAIHRNFAPDRKPDRWVATHLPSQAAAFFAQDEFVATGAAEHIADIEIPLTPREEIDGVMTYKCEDEAVRRKIVMALASIYPERTYIDVGGFLLSPGEVAAVVA